MYLIETVEDGDNLGYNSLATSGNYVVSGTFATTTGVNIDLNSGLLVDFVDYFTVHAPWGAGGLYPNEKLVGRAGSTIWISTLMRKDDFENKYFAFMLNNCPYAYGDNTKVLEFGCLENDSKDENGDYYWTLRLNEQQDRPESVWGTHPKQNRIYRTNKKIVEDETILVAMKIKFNIPSVGDDVWVYINHPLSGALPEADAYLKADWPVSNFDYNTWVAEDPSRAITPGENTVLYNVDFRRSLAFRNIGIRLGNGTAQQASIGEIKIGDSFKAVAGQAPLKFKAIKNESHITGVKAENLSKAKFNDTLIFVVYDKDRTQIENNIQILDIIGEDEETITFDKPLILPEDGKFSVYVWKGTKALAEMLPLYEEVFDVDTANSELPEN